MLSNESRPSLRDLGDLIVSSLRRVKEKTIFHYLGTTVWDGVDSETLWRFRDGLQWFVNRYCSDYSVGDPLFEGADDSLRRRGELVEGESGVVLEELPMLPAGTRDFDSF